MGPTEAGSTRTQRIVTACRMFAAAVLVAAGNMLNFRKFGLIEAQYFLQGAFYGLLLVLVARNWLPREWAISKESGQLGLLASAMMWVWALKFALGPIADLLRRHHRMVLVACNGGMAVVAVLIAQAPTGDFSFVLKLAVVASILRCLQDVTTDGIAMSSLRKEDIAAANTVMWLAQSGGFWVGGAGMLAVQTACGTDFRTLFVIVAAIVAASAILGFALGSSAKKISKAATSEEEVTKDKAPALNWQQLALAFAFGFIAQFGGGAFSGAFVGPWFQSLKFSSGIMSTLETVSSVSSIVGVLLIGLAGKRLAHKTLALGAVLAVAVSYIAVGCIASAWHHQGLMVVVIGVVTMGERMLTVALATMLMLLSSNRKAAATMYAAFASVVNASAALGPLAGTWAAKHFDYPALMILAGVIILPSLIVLWFLRVPDTKQ